MDTNPEWLWLVSGVAVYRLVRPIFWWSRLIFSGTTVYRKQQAKILSMMGLNGSSTFWVACWTWNWLVSNDELEYCTFRVHLFLFFPSYIPLTSIGTLTLLYVDWVSEWFLVIRNYVFLTLNCVIPSTVYLKAGIVFLPDISIVQGNTLEKIASFLLFLCWALDSG